MVKKLVFADSPYTLAADPNFVNNATEEVYLQCDTTGGGITINLPKISDLTFPNVKVKVTDIGGVSATVSKNITIVQDTSGTPDDTINGGAGNVVIATNNESVLLQVTSQNNLSATSRAGNWQATTSLNGKSMKRVAVTFAMSPYTCDGTEDILGVTGTADGAIAITLAPARRNSKNIIIKDEGANAAANNITVTPFAGDTINGAANIVISTNGGARQVYNAGVGTTTNFTSSLT